LVLHAIYANKSKNEIHTETKQQYTQTQNQGKEMETIQKMYENDMVAENESWTIQYNHKSNNKPKYIMKEPNTNGIKQPIFCNNCGKYGHFFYQCNNPITSIGIIAFRYPSKPSVKREYLIIRRKDTLGYIDFIRGKYSIHNKPYILNMFKQMTDEERQTILRYVKEEMSYDYKFKLWRQLWTSDPQTITQYGGGSGGGSGGNSNTSYLPHEKTIKHFKVSEEKISKDKFVILANGLNSHAYGNNSSNSGIHEYSYEKKFTKNFQKRHPFSIQTLIDECEQKYPEWRWKEQEWGFPKGRRDSQESDFICGLREFTEETGYYKSIPVDLLTFYASSKNISWTEKKKETYKLSPSPIPMSTLHHNGYSCDSLYEKIGEISEKEPNIFKNMNKITGVLNVFPFEENFVGSNQKPYKHKYYLMQMDYDTKQAEYQSSEVSNTAWKTYEECMEMFRFYNEEKKQMLTRIHCMLEHFDLV
jgi:8-oxo-dGTP pyrophosphatase MutT (NUDIX family)